MIFISNLETILRHPLTSFFITVALIIFAIVTYKKNLRSKIPEVK
jgi:hypothetical protein